MGTVSLTAATTLEENRYHKVLNEMAPYSLNQRDELLRSWFNPGKLWRMTVDRYHKLNRVIYRIRYRRRITTQRESRPLSRTWVPHDNGGKRIVYVDQTTFHLWIPKNCAWVKGPGAGKSHFLRELDAVAPRFHGKNLVRLFLFDSECMLNIFAAIINDSCNHKEGHIFGIAIIYREFSIGQLVFHLSGPLSHPPFK